MQFIVNASNFLIIASFFTIAHFSIRRFFPLYSADSDKQQITFAQKAKTYCIRFLVSFILTILFLGTFTYPKVVGTQRILKHPITVQQLSEVLDNGTFILKLQFADGRILKCDFSNTLENLQEKLKLANNQVELEKSTGTKNTYTAWISCPGGLCGNEFGLIPIVPIPRLLRAHKSRLVSGELVTPSDH